MDSNERREDAINPSISERKTQSFNLIIGIATLLIAIFGATFAYFTATARSNEGEVTVRSAMISINFERGTEIKANNLIPATQEVALNKYQKTTFPFIPGEGESYIQDYDEYVEEANRSDLSQYRDRKCIDANGREVCYVFWFSVKSDGEENENTDILAYITVNKNEFENLSYLVYEVKYDVDENQKKLLDKYGMGVVNQHTLVSDFGDYANAITSQTYPFVKFGKVKDIMDENQNITGSSHPVACLFGIKTGTDSENKPYSEYAEDSTARCKTASISNGVEHNYQIIIWLDETWREQPEQGKLFEGMVSVETGGSDITGSTSGTTTSSGTIPPGGITGQD